MYEPPPSSDSAIEEDEMIVEEICTHSIAIYVDTRKAQKRMENGPTKWA